MCRGFNVSCRGKAKHAHEAPRRPRARAGVPRGPAGGRGIALRKQAVVRTSLRRLEAYGTKDFVEWYRSDDRSTIDVMNSSMVGRAASNAAPGGGVDGGVGGMLASL